MPQVTCRACHGDAKCPACGGDGVVAQPGERRAPEKAAPDPGAVICPACKGSGGCGRCGGTGKVLIDFV
jgi:hypothetical protein